MPRSRGAVEHEPHRGVPQRVGDQAGQIGERVEVAADEPDRPLAETLESASRGKNSSRGIRGIKLEGFDPGGGNLLRCSSISLGILMLGRTGKHRFFHPDFRTLKPERPTVGGGQEYPTSITSINSARGARLGGMARVVLGSSSQVGPLAVHSTSSRRHQA